jgi:hypothetical protein
MAELKGLGRIRKGQQIEQHPRVFGFGVPRSSGLGDPGYVLAGSLVPLDVLRAALFPTTSMKALTTNQQRDLEHIQDHLRTGGDVFVHLNPTDFCRHGRREALYRMGVWASTPIEAVDHLKAWHTGIHKESP